jgi:hypothetical protein
MCNIERTVCKVSGRVVSKSGSYCHLRGSWYVNTVYSAEIVTYEVSILSGSKDKTNNIYCGQCQVNGSMVTGSRPQDVYLKYCDGTYRNVLGENLR